MENKFYLPMHMLSKKSEHRKVYKFFSSLFKIK